MIPFHATSLAKFFSRHSIVTLLLGLSLEQSSCSYYRSKDSQDLSSLPMSGVKVSYQMVRDRVFTPSCIACHGSSGGVNLESYDSVKQNLSGVENTVLVQKTMPKGRTLGDEELNILAAWIRSGAPENAETSEAVRTAPDNTNEVVLKPEFVHIKKKVFEVRCTSCHSAGGSASNILLETEKDLIDSPRKLVVPGNSAQSGLFIAITRQDAKRMPPAEGGGAALPAVEIAVIKQWIDALAPNGNSSPPGSSPSPGPSESPDPSVPPESTEPLEPFFNSIKRVILEPRCISCHASGGSASGVPLQTWKDLLDSPRELVLPGNPDESGLVIAITREDSRRMPPTGSGARPLSQNEISIVRAWITAGALERRGQVRPSPRPSPLPSSIPSPHPTPSVSPSATPSSGPSSVPSSGPSPPIEVPLPTFTSIKKLIFDGRCITCHQEGGSASGVLLRTRKDLLDSPRDLVLPGNADESGLYIAVSRQDSKRMPPPQEVSSQPLSDMEIQVIRKWILEGAIE